MCCKRTGSHPNIVSLVKNPTGSDIFDMFRNLRKIQHEASVPISYIVANHLAKVPKVCR